MKIRRRKATDNRIICAVMWWFWESHHAFPARVTWVYSFNHWQNNRGQQLWAEGWAKREYVRNLWRALGMTFVWAKRWWDRAEEKMFTKPPPKDFINAM